MDPLSARYHYLLSRALTGGLTAEGITIDFDDGKKHDDVRAKAEAGLATELDQENDRFREWYEKFQ